MLYTPHFLVGAAIVKLMPDPVIGLPLALLSHFVLDMTPHNDFDIKPGMGMRDILSSKFKNRNLFVTFYTLDILLSLSSFFWLFFAKNNYWLLVGGVMAILPDVLEQGLVLFGVRLPGWQDKLQWRVSKKYGFISYPVVCAVALWMLVK